MRSNRRATITLTLLAMSLPPACSGAPRDASKPSATREAAAPAGYPASPQAKGSPSGQIPLATSRSEGVPSAGAGSSPRGDVAWSAPAAWTSEAPSSAMRRAQYIVPKAAGDAADGECAVFYFGPGQGGDVRANLERWASQFTDASGRSAEPSPIVSQVNGLKVSKVSVEGTYNAAQMMGGGDQAPKPGYLLLGAIVEGPDANWFFKCTGPKKTMEANREAFDGMIGSVHPG
jgi:hypothetical protein